MVLHVVGYILAVSTAAGFEVSECYTVDSKNYCFYTSGSTLNWYEAKGFCLRKNSTLPIIRDETIDQMFQQFILSNSYSELHSRSIWIGAHARPVYSSVEWQWINGQTSSL